MAFESPSRGQHAAKRKEPGASWSQDEEQVLPKNRLGIVSFAFVCTMFLGVLDQVSQWLRTVVYV